MHYHPLLCCFLFLWMSVSEFPLLSLIKIYVISFRAHKKDKNKFFFSVALTWLYLLPYKVIHLSLGVCCCSVTKSCLTLCDPIECSMPGSPLPFTIAQSLFKLMSTESLIPSNHLIFCRPLPLLPSIFPIIMDFSNESVLHISWPKYCSFSFSFSFSPSNYYSGLISFRIDWLDLLAVQGTLKSLLQHHSLKASLLWCSAFFMVQQSHPYMTTGKIIALIILNFFSKVMSILLKKIYRFVIVFLQMSKHLLISLLQSSSAVILEPPKIKSLFPLFPHLFAIKWWDQMPNLSFLNVEF